VVLMAQTNLDLLFRAIDQTKAVVAGIRSSISGLGQDVRNFGAQQSGLIAITNRHGEAVSGLGNTVNAIGGKFQNAGQSLALGFTVPLVASAAVLGQFDQSAAKLQVGESFERTAKQFGAGADEIIDSLREASGGTISNLDLMQSASRAMILGVADDTSEFVQLMEIARDRARVFGVSTTQAFNDLTLGIGRQSRLILDNLGIIVRVEESTAKYAASLGKTAEELTNDEKRQGFLNAVLEQTEKTIDRNALATANASEKYMAARAQIDNLIESVQTSALPILTKFLNLFNELPNPVKLLTIALAGTMLVMGPLLSAFGATLRAGSSFSAGLGRIFSTLAAVGAGEASLTLSAASATAALEAQTVVANTASLAKARLAVAAGTATAAESALVASTVAATAAQAGFIARISSVVLGIGQIARGSVILVARFVPFVSVIMAVVAGFRSLWAAVIEGQSAMDSLRTGFNLVTGGVFKKLSDNFKTDAERIKEAKEAPIRALELAREGMSKEWDKFIKQQYQPATGAGASLKQIGTLLNEQYMQILEGFSGPVVQFLTGQNSLISAHAGQLESYVTIVDSIIQKSKLPDDVKNGWIEGTQTIRALFQAMSETATPEELRTFYDRLISSVEEGSPILVIAEEEWGTIIDTLNSVSPGVNAAAEAFKNFSSVLRSFTVAQTELGNALSAIGQIESLEQIKNDLAGINLDLAINARMQELGGEATSKTTTIINEYRAALERESDALGIQISTLDLLIREKEAHVKLLAPQKLLDEIEMIETGVELQERHARSIQRDINAIERQASAIERLNRPLERNVALMDLQMRRIELASRPARRRLEDANKVVGLSKDVIRALEAEVKRYDDRIAIIQDSSDAMKIQIDQRQLEADLIRDTSSALKDELDILNDNIEAQRDLVSKRRDFIATLAPRKLLNEIEDLKRSRDELDLNRQRLDLLIQKAGPAKTTLSGMMDPVIAKLQQSKRMTDLQGQAIDLMRLKAATEIKLKFSSLGLAEIALLYSALSRGMDLSKLAPIFNVARSMRSLGASDSAIATVMRGLLQIGYGPISMAEGAGLVGAVPFQHGGVVTRPTFAMLGERGAEAVIPLNRGLPAGMSAPNITIHIEGNVYGDEEWADEIATKIRRRLR